MKQFFSLFFISIFVLVSSVTAKTWQLSNNRLQVSFDDANGLFTVRDLNNGKIWTQCPLAEKITIKKVKQEKNSLHITMEGSFPFTAHVLLSQESGLEFVLSAGKNMPVKDFNYPAAFHTDSKDFYLLYTDGEGMLLPVDNTEYPLGNGITYSCGGGLSMAWMGVTDKQFNSGYMAILETPFDAALCTSRQDDGLVTFAPIWLPSLETFGYDRKITYYFFDKGGYVAQCKKYRDYIWKKNQVTTLKEKLKKSPAIGKMIGAPHIYVWDTAREVSFAREMKDSGIEKALILWNGNHTPYPELGYDNRMKELGYGTGGYDLYSDLHKRDTAYYEHDWDGPLRYRRTRYPGMFHKLAARKKDGSTYSNQFGTYACPATMLPQIEQRVSREMKEYPHECYFLDVYQANGLYECYSKDHPLTRQQYAEAIIKNYQYIEDTFGQYMGGEWGADFAVAYSVFVHGMMTLQRTWFGSEINKQGSIYYYGNWKNNSRPSIMLGTRTAPDTYLKYSINEAIRVPLYELVYHDAVVTSWRWEDGNHHNPEIWWKKDLFNILYGSVPLWSLDRNRWEEYKQTFIQSYNNVCPWLQKIGYDEMLSHSFVTPDGKIQMSEFSSGNRVVVNFSDTDYSYEGKIVKSRSFLPIEL